MKIRLEQLPQQLQKNLAPLYLVSGDEPLLLQQARDSIQRAAIHAGIQEREILHVESGFDWGRLHASTHNLSLFSPQTLIELRLGAHKLGTAGSKALQTYAQQPPENSYLIITSTKLDASTQKSRWFKAIESAGVVIQVWPLDKRQFYAWISNRIRVKGLTADKDGIHMLADFSDGNLLAAAQEIEKLQLLHGSKKITVRDIAAAIADNARFDIFKLVDTAMAGEQRQVLRILNSLRQQAMEPTLILWVITRELRSLIALANSVAQGTPIHTVLQQQRVWEKRKPLVKQILQRQSPTSLYAMLKTSANIDQTIKGILPGNVWDQLTQLYLCFAGAKDTSTCS